MRSIAVRSLSKKQAEVVNTATSHSSLSNVMITGKEHSVASYAQQRIWLAEKMRFNPTTSGTLCVYNTLLPLFLTSGSMSIAKIRTALNAVIEQHPILRTAVFFNTITGVLEQKIMPNTDDRFSFVITRDIQSEEHLDALLQAEVITAFSKLDQGLVVRCHLFQRSDNEKDSEHLYKGDLILFAFHHIAFDLSSAKPFILTFTEAYDHPNEWIAKKTLQYIDFTLYERNQLNNTLKLKQACSVWSSILEGYQSNNLNTMPLIKPEIQNPHPVTRSGKAFSIAFNLDKTIVEEQMHFAAKNSVSMFQLGIACFFAFLHKMSYLETNDLCILSLVDNRSLIELKSMIGMFVNIVPYRLRIDKNMSFMKLVEDLRHLHLKVIEYSYLPYQEILECSTEKRPPLIEICFQYESHLSNLSYKTQTEIATHDARMGGDENRYLSHNNGTSAFDLSLTFCHNHEQRATQCFFECSADLFDENIINILALHFQCLVKQLFSRSILDQKEISISQLSILLPQEFSEVEMTTFQRLPKLTNEGRLYIILEPP